MKPTTTAAAAAAAGTATWTFLIVFDFVRRGLFVANGPSSVTGAVVPLSCHNAYNTSEQFYTPACEWLFWGAFIDSCRLFCRRRRRRRCCSLLLLILFPPPAPFSLSFKSNSRLHTKRPVASALLHARYLHW